MDSAKEIPRFSHLLRSDLTMFPSGTGEWSKPVNLAELQALRTIQPPPPADDDDIHGSEDTVLTFNTFISNSKNEKPTKGLILILFTFICFQCNQK